MNDILAQIPVFSKLPAAERAELAGLLKTSRSTPISQSYGSRGRERFLHRSERTVACSCPMSPARRSRWDAGARPFLRRNLHKNIATKQDKKTETNTEQQKHNTRSKKHNKTQQHPHKKNHNTQKHKIKNSRTTHTQRNEATVLHFLRAPPELYLSMLTILANDSGKTMSRSAGIRNVNAPWHNSGRAGGHRPGRLPTPCHSQMVYHCRILLSGTCP